MPDRGSIKVTVLVILGAGLLMAVPASLANVYRDGDPLTAVTLQNPVVGQCYATDGTAAGSVNGTDDAAEVFKDNRCKQLEATIGPGRSERSFSFASVKFTEAGFTG